MKNPVMLAAAFLLMVGSFFVTPSAEARFLQVDPIGYEDHMNLYAYVHNDPVNMIDPTGRAGLSSAANGGHKILPTPPQSQSGDIVGQVALGFTPVGVAIDVYDMDQALEGGDIGDIVVAALAFIPGGDALKGGNKVFTFKDITKVDNRGRSSVRNVETNATATDVSNTLEKRGYTAETSKDGRATTYTRDGSRVKYSVTTGNDRQPKVDVRAQNEAGKESTKVKVRLEEERK